MDKIEDAISTLQKIPSTGDVSVFDHLTAVVAKILEEKQSAAVDLLETSYLLKRATLSKTTLTSETTTQGEDSKFFEKFSSLLKYALVRRCFIGRVWIRDAEPRVDEQTGEAIDLEPANTYTCQDIVGDGYLFESLGVGLPRQETVMAALMAKQLGEDPLHDVDSLRLFGKFLTLGDPYYVFETKTKTEIESPEVEEDLPMELNSGANGHVYFVCRTPGSSFSRLPNAKPSCIRAARQIQRFLTGSLETDVCAFPLFPGNEADYLRAQIARIEAATVVCPVGFFALNDEGVVEKTTEPQVPSGELGELDSWCHLTPHLKQQGRCSVYRREAEGEEETIEWTEEEQEEGPEFLSTLNGDSQGPYGHRWTVASSSSLRHLHHQVLCVRSNVWPGAFCIAKGHQYANIYVGWGCKEAPYAPPALPIMQTESEIVWIESTLLPAKPEMPMEE